MSEYIGKHEKKEPVIPMKNYSEFPGVYYWFCGSCGNGIDKGEEKCPICLKKVDWSKIEI